MPCMDKSALSAAAANTRPAERGEIGRRRDTLVLPITMTLCVILATVTALGPLSRLFSQISIDYGEGWNAYWVAAAMGFGPLYAKTHVLVANNYPPLSFYVTGLLGQFVGDYIVAGRIVALLSMVTVALLIARIVAKMGAPLRWALAAAIVFLVYNLIYFSQFVAVDNPQWLGQAIMLTGLLPLLDDRQERLRWQGVVLSAAVMVAGGLVKHNQIALPIAVTIWLMLRDRRALAIWCGAGAVFVAMACLALMAAYGPAVFVELVGFKRTMDLENFRQGLGKIGCLAPLAGIAIVSAHWRRADKRWLLLALYAAFGLVLGNLQRLGAGVYVNAHFDALIGLVTVAFAFLGMAAAGRLERAPSKWSRSVLLLVLLIPLAIVAPNHVRRSISEMRHLPPREAAWSRVIADVRATPGPVLCEVPAICYWAGKPFLLDFFAYGQKLRTGTNPAPLERLVEREEIPMLVLDQSYDRQAGQGRLPAPLPAMMRAHYKVVRDLPEEIAEMVPRGR